MKVSEQWLREWVNPNVSTEELAALLTMNGLEVDQVHPVAAPFEGVVVAYVRDTQPHPQADKLTLCQVDAGEEEPLSIVCGAANVRKGLKVALAKVGAQLPNGLKIKPAKLRGEVSNGMLCSVEELGISERSEDILELDKEAPVGMALRDYLFLNDKVFDIDLTPNRGDCLSVLGIAREVGAKLDLPISEVSVSAPPVETEQTLQVDVQAGEGCPLYVGQMLTDIRVDAVTPVWMKERLRRAGIRAIHPVVDVAQYVMLELGQPMHAFDAHKIGEQITVRYAKEHETLTLLDGQSLKIQSHTLLIADRDKPLALAGIMGGVDSAVNEDTTHVFLESAFFTPRSIIGIARQHGLVTDASYRYERGVDPTLPERALDRAMTLLIDIVGGQAGPKVCVKQPSAWFEPKKVDFRPAHVEKRIGIAVPEERMKQILLSLGFEIHVVNPSEWCLTIPSYRFDIHIEEDVIEEVIRIYGYDHLPAKKMDAEIRLGHVDPIVDCENKIIKQFFSLGYQECITYTFVDPALQTMLFPDNKGLMLANPLSPELSQMRISLWPGLLASMLYNANRQHDAIALFETGNVFDTTSGSMNEVMKVAAILTGTKGSLDWGQPTSTFDFYDLKGDVEALFEVFSISNLHFEAATHPTLHPGKTAKLVIDGQTIGWCGALHPNLTQLLDINTDVYLFECDMQVLVKKSSSTYQPISKFPQIRRDMAFIADKSLPFSAIESVIRSVDLEGVLRSVHIFDVYTGESIPKDKKSLALALFMQSQVKTLNEKEINCYLCAIIDKLEEELSIKLRDGTS